MPGYPEIFVVGDMMALNDLPGVAEVAMQSGAHAGHTIRRRLKGDTVLRPFHYHDLGTLAVISRFRAVAKVGPLRWAAWRLAAVAGGPHHVPDRLQEPIRRAGPLGRELRRARPLRAGADRALGHGPEPHRRICKGSGRPREDRGSTMPITVTPIEGLSDHINDIRIRTARIVNEEILPNESALWNRGSGNVTEEEQTQSKELRTRFRTG